MTAAPRATGASLAGHDSSSTVALLPQDDAFDALRLVLGNLAATIDANLEGAVADTDPEFLHQLRVAMRRTRSVLTQCKGVLPTEVRARYRADFGWLGQVTGPPRDLDVYVSEWSAYVAPLGDIDAAVLDRIRTELVARQAAAHRHLAATLRDDASVEVLASWRRWLADPSAERRERQPIGPFIARRIERAQHKVLRHGRSITPDSAPERLHDLRKDTKRLRYLIECFGSLFEAKPRKAFVSQLKALQVHLGDHQDAVVHLTQLRALVQDLHLRPDSDSDVLLAMDRLSDHLDQCRRQERADFATCFAAYDTKTNRRALADLVRQAADT